MRILGIWFVLRFGYGHQYAGLFKGLEYSTPINSTVIITTTPIMVFIFAILLKSKWHDIV